VKAQDRASAVNIGSKGEVLRSFALKAFGINAIALSMANCGGGRKRWPFL
jgi:hypothetical protein